MHRGSIHRLRISVAITAVVALVLSGCGPAAPASPGAGSPGAGSPAPGATAGPTATTAAEPVELTILEHQDPRIAELKVLLPKFEAEMQQQGRNVTVRLLEGPAPDSEFLTKVTLDYNAGNAADVTSYGASAVPGFVDAGYLLDLTDRLNGWADYPSFYQVLRDEAVQADGRTYTVPREATVQQFFYRKDVLETHGISTDQPETWADLLARMEELAPKLGKPPILIPAAKPWGGGTFWEGFIHLMLGTDSPLYDESDGKWVVRSPGLTSVFNFYESLAKANLLPVDALVNPEPWVPTKYEAFPKGELAVATCGTWCWIFDWGPGTRGEIPDIFDRVATWEFPSETGGTFIWGATGWVWAVSAQSEHPEEAFELVKWLASGEALATHMTTIGAASPRDDIGSVAPYSEMPFLIDAEQSLARGRSFQPRPGIDKIEQAVGEATEEIITGRMTGQEAADLFANSATSALGADQVKELP